MSWISSLVGAAGGAAGSLGNSALNQYFVGQNMKAQYSYWKKAQLNQYSLQRQGLEKAGYNPMLALSGGSASFTPSVSSYTPDLVSSAKSGAEIARSLKLAEKEAEARIDNIETDTQNKHLDTWGKGLNMFTELLEAAMIGKGLAGQGTSAKSPGAKSGNPTVPRKPAKHPFNNPDKYKPKGAIDLLPESKSKSIKPNPFSKMIPWLVPLAFGGAKYGLPLLGVGSLVKPYIKSQTRQGKSMRREQFIHGNWSR